MLKQSHVVAVVVILVSAQFAFAQANASALDTSSQPITQKQASELLEELKAVRKLLEANRPVRDLRQQGKPASLSLNVSGRPALGSPTAPITIVEFIDYECSFCKRFHRESQARLMSELVDTGQVRFISLDFPLSFHRYALTGAEAVRCSGDQDKYWEMRERLLLLDRLDSDQFNKIASELSLDQKAFKECMDRKKHQPAILAESSEATRLGVPATPAFLIAPTTPEGELKGELIVGAVPLATIRAAINNQTGVSRKSPSGLVMN